VKTPGFTISIVVTAVLAAILAGPTAHAVCGNGNNNHKVMIVHIVQPDHITTPACASTNSGFDQSEYIAIADTPALLPLTVSGTAESQTKAPDGSIEPIDSVQLRLYPGTSTSGFLRRTACQPCGVSANWSYTIEPGEVSPGTYTLLALAFQDGNGQRSDEAVVVVIT